MIEFIIPGKPIPLRRARGSAHGYYDSQYQAKKNIQWLFNEQFPRFIPLTGPLSVKFIFHMQIPSSISEKKKRELIQTPNVKKVDTSNMIKFYEDSLNEITWHDDCQIYEIYAIKLYSTEPKTILQIEEKND